MNSTPNHKIAKGARPKQAQPVADREKLEQLEKRSRLMDFCMSQVLRLLDEDDFDDVMSVEQEEAALARFFAKLTALGINSDSMADAEVHDVLDNSEKVERTIVRHTLDDDLDTTHLQILFKLARVHPQKLTASRLLGARLRLDSLFLNHLERKGFVERERVKSPVPTKLAIGLTQRALVYINALMNVPAPVEETRWVIPKVEVREAIPADSPRYNSGEPNEDEDPYR